jgi:hypothetical protein
MTKKSTPTFPYHNCLNTTYGANFPITLLVISLRWINNKYYSATQ